MPHSGIRTGDPSAASHETFCDFFAPDRIGRFFFTLFNNSHQLQKLFSAELGKSVYVQAVAAFVSKDRKKSRNEPSAIRLGL
jgi:hypothetical protein